MNALRNLALAGTLCIPILALCETSLPNDYVALLKTAAKSMDNDYQETWAFTETFDDSESETVGRYDPSHAKGERWTLITIDDREPTADEIDDYLSDKTNDSESQDSEEDSDETSQDDDISQTVRPDSLTLLEETETYWLFSFTPAAEDDDDEGVLENLDGTLKIIKDGNYIEYLNMQATKPFKPRFGVKIKEFLTRLSFGPAADGGPIVPLSIEVNLKIRAFVLANVNESITTTYSDYHYVGDRRIVPEPPFD